ncbi:MAG: glycosyltransferase family 4 protein [Oculatellaceae cyanobacterium bins.114]|nr:glycosyltransferase family 4 protein [Oculatellaceae cyanobacterium bins.114]
MRARNRVLIVVENLPVPFDRRVWMEATTLQKAGYEVSVICPMGKGYEKDYEILEGIHIYRHPLPDEMSSVFGYLREYSSAVRWEFQIAHRVWRERRFDIMHLCNPPDLLFITALWFKLVHGIKVIFDHHDLSPEMYEAKYNRRDIFYHGLKLVERLTYITADIAISTNESHKSVALNRGHMPSERVFIVRSAPDIARFRPTPPNKAYYCNRHYLVGYMGVMGEPEGVDYLLRVIHYLVTVKNRRDIHFMLIGGGPAFDKLVALSQTLGITDFVEFTGFKTGHEFLERLSTCDICVEPSPLSAYNQCCTMNKILEYMALGKPIVQFDLKEGRYSAQGASLYAQPNDEVEFAERILELLESSALRQQLGAEGKRRMEEELEWRHQAPILLKAYESISASVKES